MVYSGITNLHSWKDQNKIVDSGLSVLTCSLCQMVCIPGLGKRKQNYHALVDSGHIEDDDPSLLHPTGRNTDWVYPTLESVAAMTAATESDSD